MKGFYIYEAESRIGTEVDCLKIGYIDHMFTHQIDSGTLSEEVKMHALVSKGTKTRCSPDDTYDFEVVALIALMKMCGLEKVVRACNEAFPKERYNTYIAKLEGELRDLKKDFNKVRDLKDFYKKNYEDVKEHYDKLGDRNKYLIDDINKKLEYIKEKDEENKKLKSDKDKSWKNYQRNIQKKQDRINELEAQVKASEDDKQKNIEYYEKEIKRLEASNCAKGILNGKLLKDYNTAQNAYEVMVEKSADLMDKVKKLEEENEKLKGNIDELFESEQHTKTELGRLYFEKHRLEEENEKLKLDCEKLQHGYNDMIFCSGRQNGKQFTFLVDLFKKIDQKKVDAAYKEAYNTTLPIWQKEVLNQMYGVYKESKEKTVWLTSQSFTRDYLDSILESSKYAIPYTTEWIKPPTKREEMWGKIIKIHKENNVVIVVEKENVDAFLHEIENRIPEIRWASWQKIFEAKGTIKDIYETLKTCDRIYFRLWKENELSYSSDPNIYQYRDLEHISYLPPMRWDLFEKGRKIVRVTPENIDDFIVKRANNLGAIMKPNLKRCKDFTHSFIMISDYHYDNRPTLHIMSPEDLVRNQHENPKKYSDKKIVDWEDVR